MSFMGYSRYKDSTKALTFLTQWNQQVIELAGLSYQQVSMQTDWGKTVVWVHTPKRRIYQTLVFLPDFHSPALAWDINQSLTPFKKNYRLCLVEINGQPNLSEGKSPAINSNEYGRWIAQVLEQLGAKKVTLIGQGMGALISLKACQQVPDLIRHAILINPAGIQTLSLSFALLRYYWLALDTPNEQSIRSFLRNAVFGEHEAALPPAVETLLASFHLHALTEFQFETWWNQAMPKEELSAVRPPVDILLGAANKLFTYAATLERARLHLPSLRSVTVLPTLGHGIQTSRQAIVSVEAMLGYQDRQP